MEYVLEVKNLSKRYNEGISDGIQFSKKAMEDISFNIYEDCVTGFIGMNGAGKTTTIKTILGLLNQDSGEIKVFGLPMKKHEKEIKNRIGIVFDQGYLYDDLTLQEMKQVIAPAYTNWDEKEFKRRMEQFTLNPKKKIKELSKGMHMKYAIALALSHHADLLIMDEPTSGLDPVVRNQLLSIIREFMKEEGKSVFFSTHITTDLDKVADEIIMIDKGRIILQEEKDSLIERHALVQGNREWLTSETKQLFVSYEVRGFNFEGLTADRIKVKQVMEKAIMMKPTIEDIMVNYVGRLGD